jgi:hypothetical protein
VKFDLSSFILLAEPLSPELVSAIPLMPLEEANSVLIVD